MKGRGDCGRSRASRGIFLTEAKPFKAGYTKIELDHVGRINTVNPEADHYTRLTHAPNVRKEPRNRPIADVCRPVALSRCPELVRCSRQPLIGLGCLWNWLEDANRPQ